jgi:hypothetical protein
MPGKRTENVAEWVRKHLPLGQDRDEVLRLVRLGATFQAQQAGKRPAFLANYLHDMLERTGPLSFDDLLIELEREAWRRENGEETPIERVDRIWEMLTYHDPKKGRRQITLATLRNKLTKARRKK